jgi:hypothetical protein
MDVKHMLSGLSAGFTKGEQTQTLCKTVHDELASLRQTAVREDGSSETQKARSDILTLAQLLDGDGVLDYLVKIRDENRRELENQ